MDISATKAVRIANPKTAEFQVRGFGSDFNSNIKYRIQHKEERKVQRELLDLAMSKPELCIGNRYVKMINHYYSAFLRNSVLLFKSFMPISRSFDLEWIFLLLWFCLYHWSGGIKIFQSHVIFPKQHLVFTFSISKIKLLGIFWHFSVLVVFLSCTTAAQEASVKRYWFLSSHTRSFRKRGLKNLQRTYIFRFINSKAKVVNRKR